METDTFPTFSPFHPRVFVPSDADLTNLKLLKDLFGQLSGRDIRSVHELEKWINDRSELDAAIDQTEAVLYILMTCQTDNPERAEAYKKYTQEVQPFIKEWDDALNKKLIEADTRYRLARAQYGVLLRNIETDMRLFRQENVQLEKEEEDIKQKYQAVCGAMTVIIDGKEMTLQEAGKILFDPDRRKRETAWKAVAARRIKDKDELDDIMSRLVSIRHRIGKNAGFNRFSDYQFLDQHKFDYTPEDSKAFHTAARDVVLPVWKKMTEKRKQMMSLEKLRPWDTAVDPLSRPPLKPFSTTNEFTQGCKDIFGSVHSFWGEQFSQMIRWKVLDLESRKGKAPGGYQSTLQEARRPFIFMNAVGIDSDVRTLLHEGGHAFHALACAPQSIVDYRHAPLEFCEVASMGMELLGGEYLDVFYRPEEKRRSQVDHLEDVIWTLLWVATIDKFQHWLYENPEHTANERASEWGRIYNMFGGDLIDWSGLEYIRDYLWHRQLHIFEIPFYYIEYAIAQLGALQLWQLYKKDRKGTVNKFEKALSLGGSEPLPKLFEAAGIKFDFSRKTIAEAVSVVESEWDDLV
jgi:oligoendopeptidase F